MEVEGEADKFLNSMAAVPLKTAESVTSSSSSSAYKSIRVFPGDDITNHVKSFLAISGRSCEAAAGKGLEASGDAGDNVICNLAGETRFRPPNHFWVEPSAGIVGSGGADHARRYLPLVGDQVVGIVEDRQAEHYRVNIHSVGCALLPRLGFEGATKRNKPELRRGAVVYGRLTEVDVRVGELEMTCRVPAAGGLTKDWSSGEAVCRTLVEAVMCQRHC